MFRRMLQIVAVLWALGWQVSASIGQVTLSEVERGGLAHYKIATPSGTYLLEKSGAGLAQLLDREGNDWLGFAATPGSGAAGEFRGFPNAVHQQAGNYFHPRNQATEPSQIRIEHQSRERIRIAATSENQLWAGHYDFFSTHCTFTMTKMPPDKKYWVLYEGTPGGRFDQDDWWVTSSIAARQSMTRSHDGDIPAPEWIAFGDPRLERVLFLVHHQDDGHPDRFYAMRSQMTVFGFGRSGASKFLNEVPQSFSIGLLETTEHAEIGRQLAKLLTASAPFDVSGR